MPKPPFMNLLITMSSEPQRDVNGTAIQTFGAKWSERDLRASILVGVSLLKYFETCEGSLAWMTFSATKASAKNTVLKVARLAKQTANNVLQLTLLASQDKAWRKSPCVLRPSKKPKVSLMAQISLCVCGVSYSRASSASSAAYYSSRAPVCRCRSSCFARRESPCCWCWWWWWWCWWLQLQSSLQGWGKRTQRIWAPWRCRHHKKNAPEWFEETLPKTAMGEHKDAGKWHKIPSSNWKS